MKVLILLVVAMLLVAGCAGQAKADVKVDDKMMDNKNKPKDDVMKKTPSFWIDSPAQDSTVSAGDVVVSMGVENFKIGVPETANKDNEGHFHLYLDNGDYMPCAATKCTVAGVSDGAHVIKVTMHQNDHSLYPGVEAKMVSVMAKGAPDFEIMSPTQGGTAARGNVAVKLKLMNFAIGQPETANKDNEGHFHLYLDNGDYIPCASETCEVPSVGPGSHTVKVDMRNNDHSLYGDGNVKEVAFTVR